MDDNQKGTGSFAQPVATAQTAQEVGVGVSAYPLHPGADRDRTDGVLFTPKLRVEVAALRM
jgi:hypothetical protein